MIISLYDLTGVTCVVVVVIAMVWLLVGLYKDAANSMADAIVANVGLPCDRLRKLR